MDENLFPDPEADALLNPLLAAPDPKTPLLTNCQAPLTPLEQKQLQDQVWFEGLCKKYYTILSRQFRQQHGEQHELSPVEIQSLHHHAVTLSRVEVNQIMEAHTQRIQRERLMRQQAEQIGGTPQHPAILCTNVPPPQQWESPRLGRPRKFALPQSPHPPTPVQNREEDPDTKAIDCHLPAEHPRNRCYYGFNVNDAKLDLQKEVARLNQIYAKSDENPALRFSIYPSQQNTVIVCTSEVLAQLTGLRDIACCLYLMDRKVNLDHSMDGSPSDSAEQAAAQLAEIVKTAQPKLKAVIPKARNIVQHGLQTIVDNETRWSAISQSCTMFYNNFSGCKGRLVREDQLRGNENSRDKLAERLGFTRLQVWRALEPEGDEELAG